MRTVSKEQRKKKKTYNCPLREKGTGERRNKKGSVGKRKSNLKRIDRNIGQRANKTSK
jgi:hypothetical protein